MNYSQYLMGCLVKHYDPIFEELEHDLQYEQILGLYYEFLDGIYDIPTKGLYECLTDFLTNKFRTNENNT